MAFCKWLTTKEREENLIEDQQVYRLPTDLEWSLAAAWLTRVARHQRRETVKLRMSFPGENNGRRPTTEEIIPQSQGSAAAQRCR